MSNVENVIAFLAQAVKPRTPPPIEVVFETHRLREAASAAEKGDLRTLEMLKNQGADFDEPTPKNITLLMYALAKSDETAVRTLLAAGANPNVVTKNGTSAMLVAMTNLDSKFILMLLEKGGDPNLVDENKEPLVHQTISLGAFQNLGELFQAGVPVDTLNKMGQTPALRLAYLNQYQDVARLMDLGANPDITDQVGLSIRKLAAKPLPNANSPLETWRKEVAKRLGLAPEAQ